MSHVHVFVTEKKLGTGTGYLKFRAKKDGTVYKISGGQPFHSEMEMHREEILSRIMNTVFVCLPADSYSIEIRRDE